MKRRSARFDPNAAPLLELSLEENKVQQQGLEEGWTLMEVGSKCEICSPESGAWILAQVIGFATPSTKAKLLKNNAEATTIEALNVQQEEYVSREKMVAHYGALILVETTSKSLKPFHIWALYDKAHTVIRPLKQSPSPRRKSSYFSFDLSAPTSTKISRPRKVKMATPKIKHQIPKKEEPPTTMKRKREKLEPIVFGKDFETLKQTCYSFKNRIGRSMKNEVHKVLDSLEIVHPEKFQRLVKHIGLSQADAFKEAGKDTTIKLSGTSLYCFVGYRDLQRTTVLEAGKEAYIASTGKSVEKFEAEDIPPPPPTPEKENKKPIKKVSQDLSHIQSYPAKEISTERRQKRFHHNLEELDLSTWTYSHIRTASTPVMYDVLLILKEKPTVTISLGQYATLDLAERAGALGAKEAENYVRARKKGLNGANLTPVKALRNDKRSIFKNLKRVIPGRVSRQLGQTPTMTPRASTRVNKSNTERVSRNRELLPTTSMTLRKKRRISTNDSLIVDEVDAKEFDFNDFSNELNIKKKRHWPAVRVSYGSFGKYSLVNWHSEAYVCGATTYYGSFSFYDVPDTTYKLLDYVLVARPEREEDEKGNKKFVFSIGQLEAIYIDKLNNSEIPTARISWFYWQDETKLSKADIKRYTGCSKSIATEVYSSSDVEEHPLTNIYGKVDMLTVSEMEIKCTRKNMKEIDLFPKKLQEQFTIPLGLQYEDKENLIINANEMKMRAKRKLIRSYLRDLVPPSCEMIVCCSHHYDSRQNLILGENHKNRGFFDGTDPFVLPYMKLSLKSLDLTSYYRPEDYSNYLSSRSRQVVDLSLIPSNCLDAPYETPILHKIKQGTRKNIPTRKGYNCSFCSVDLTHKAHVLCKICEGCYLCLDCLAERRQGRVGVGRSQIHRSAHPYKIIPPSDLFYPDVGISLLQHYLSYSGLITEQLQLIPVEFVRGPSKDLGKAVSVRYLFAVRLIMKLPGKQKSQIITVCSKFHGKTLNEAQGLACFQALAELFGIQTKFDVYPLGRKKDFTAADAIHLLQLIQRFGFSWDVLLKKINLCSLSNIMVKDFYYDTMLPYFFSSIEKEEFSRISSKCQAVLRTKFEDKSFFPGATKIQIHQLVSDAMVWAASVKRFLLRRSKLFQANKKGLSFAVVNKSTIFQPKPKAFGPLTTSSTPKLSNMFIQLAKLLKDSTTSENTEGLTKMLIQIQKFLPESVDSAGTDNSNDLQRDIKNCDICNTALTSNNSVNCDGCDCQFHMLCNPQISSQTQYFCASCVEDRSYIYDHTSWGRSGRILSKIADQNIYFSLTNLKDFLTFDFTVDDENSSKGDEEINLFAKKFRSGSMLTEKEVNLFVRFCNLKGLEVPLVKKDWEDNDTVLMLATKNAILEGWGESNPQQGSNNVTKSYSKVQRRHISDLVTIDRDFIMSVNWATRHFANEEISSLKIANAALAQALNEVTAQRDSLLLALQKTMESKLN